MRTIKNIGRVSWILWLTLVLSGFRPVADRTCHNQDDAPCTCCCAAGQPTKTESSPGSAASCTPNVCSTTVNPADISVGVSVSSAQDISTGQPSPLGIYHQWLRWLLVASHDADACRSHSYASPPFERDVFLRLRVLRI